MIKKQRLARKKRVRAKVVGSAARPRISVYRSNKMIYGQVIDDAAGVTLVAAQGVDPKKVGEEIAKKAKKKKIETAVFDRSGFAYHGKVKQFCEAVRESGIKI